MTVCISVACDRYPEDVPTKLIMVSDTLLTMDITSTYALKARGLSNTWSVMIAGDDVTYAESVISMACGIIDTKKTRSLSDAAFSMARAYQSVRRSVIEEEFLSTYDLDLRGFLDKGPDFPTASKRQSVLDNIEKFDLGCTFMISGFSPGKAHPYVFEVTNPGKYLPHSSIGYWAIGSGAINAITYLARRNQSPGTNFQNSIYNAIAAKKLAEKATGVGPETNIYILEAGLDGIRWLDNKQVRAVSEMWEKEEAHIRPQNLEERIRKIIDPTRLPISVPKDIKQLTSGKSESSS